MVKNLKTLDTAYMKLICYRSLLLNSQRMGEHFHVLLKISKHLTLAFRKQFTRSPPLRAGLGLSLHPARPSSQCMLLASSMKNSYDSVNSLLQLLQCSHFPPITSYPLIVACTSALPESPPKAWRHSVLPHWGEVFSLSLFIIGSVVFSCFSLHIFPCEVIRIIFFSWAFNLSP